MGASVLKWGSLLLLVNNCLGLPTYEDPILNNPDFTEKGQKIYFGDVLLTPNDEKKIENKVSFTTEGDTWPRYFGQPVIPYYIDHPDPYVKKLVEEAVKHYEEHTCLKWVEVHKKDKRHKVRFYQGGGCSSYVGKLTVKYPEQDISIGPGCEVFKTLVHEMGHASGLHHTQQGPDRDDYVVLDMSNVQPGKEHNFQLKLASTNFNIRYDYYSVMHYNFLSFSKDRRPTIIAKDIGAQYLMGNNKEGLTFTDMKAINLGYKCTVDWLSRCPYQECQNGGYTGPECKCVCPSNTAGDLCEEVTGPIYPPNPLCGGDVTSPGKIKSPHFYIPTEKPTTLPDCSWWIQAPKCQLPVFTLTKFNFTEGGCRMNQLTIRNEDLYFGTTYCSNTEIEVGRVFTGKTKDMVLHFYAINDQDQLKTHGFEGSVSFIEDPAC